MPAALLTAYSTVPLILVEEAERVATADVSAADFIELVSASLSEPRSCLPFSSVIRSIEVEAQQRFI